MSEPVDFDVSPFVVIWENTRACDLACVHCRAAAQPRRSQFELTTEEGFHLIDEVADLKPRVFVITGGDPLKRDDTYDMIRHAKDRGLEPALTPSASPLLTEAAISRMKRHGLARIALSLDASRADLHDDFRRVKGSYDLTLRAIRAATREVSRSPYRVSGIGARARSSTASPIRSSAPPRRSTPRPAARKSRPTSTTT